MRENSFFKFKGILGNLVFTNGSKLGPVIRRRPKKSRRPKSAAFKAQAARASFLNQLAGEIKRVVKSHHPSFTAYRLYNNILRRFRTEPTNNRFLLLQQLKGMEINSYYKLDKLTDFETICDSTPGAVNIILTTTRHPAKAPEKYDGYVYELLLIYWSAKSNKSKNALQHTAWLPLTGDHERFDFTFNVPKSTTHWLLCLHAALGKEGKESRVNPDQGMQFWDAGTFLKTDLQLLKQRKDTIAAVNIPGKKEKVEKIRVKGTPVPPKG